MTLRLAALVGLFTGCAPKGLPVGESPARATLVQIETSDVVSEERESVLTAVAKAPVRPCFEALLGRSPNAYGEVVVRFTIGTAGLVEESEPAFATLGDEVAEVCVADAVRRVQFAPRAEALDVRYPFLLLTERTPPEVARALKDRYGLLPRGEVDASGDPSAPVPPGVVVVW